MRRTRHALGVLTIATIVSGAGVASAASLAIAPSYPQRIGGRAPSNGINHNECRSPLEKWRFAFTIPAVSYDSLQIFARKTPGSCLDPIERGPTGACRVVARFARTDVDSGPIDVPSAAMITAGDLGVDVVDLATLDRDKACFPDGDRTKAPLTLAMLLFQGADVVGTAGEATYATSYDLAAPDAPKDFAATVDGPTVHTTWTPLSSTAGVKALHAFCFDLDAAGDAGDAPCEIPPGFVTHGNHVALGFDDFICATAAPSAGTLDLAGLVPGHQYVLTLSVLDDADNSGALSPPSCARLSSVPPSGGDAGPPPLPPVNACNCRAAGTSSSGATWAMPALLSMLLCAMRRRTRG